MFGRKREKPEPPQPEPIPPGYHREIRPHERFLACELCGGLTADQALHTEWHRSMGQEMPR